MEVHVKGESVFGNDKHKRKGKIYTTEKSIKKRDKVVNKKRNWLKNDLVKLIIDSRIEERIML